MLLMLPIASRRAVGGLMALSAAYEAADHGDVLLAMIHADDG